MVMIPVSFALATVMLALLWREFHHFKSPNRNYFLIAFLTLLVFQLILVGLRFGYGLDALRRVYPIGASLMGPLAFLSFHKSESADGHLGVGTLVHLIPLFLVCVLSVFAANRIDLLLGAVTLLYAGLLTRLGLQGHDGLAWASLSRSVDVYRTLWFCSVLLVLSGIADLLIALDYWRTGGANTDSIVSKTIVMAFVWFALALLVRRFLIARQSGKASNGASGYPGSIDDSAIKENPRLSEVSSLENDQLSVNRSGAIESDASDELLELVLASIRQQNLHLDPDLNLNRLARRIGIVQRQVSEVINRKKGLSVSQFINGMRIDVACEKLIETDMSITDIMLASGFNTKSNFNREFKRCTNMSPSAYRKSITGG